MFLLTVYTVFQEEEKKENNNENEVKETSENEVIDETVNCTQDNPDKNTSDISKSPVRTRSKLFTSTRSYYVNIFATWFLVDKQFGFCTNL